MIFNINFFLFSFGQSFIWSYTFVYAKHYANITNSQFGFLSMIIPLLIFFIKPACCSLADSKGIHRQLLVASLSTFAISYGSLGIIPFFKDHEDHSTDDIAWIVIAIILTIGALATACTFCMNDALASNYARKHNLSYSRMRIFASLGWASGALLMIVIGDVSWLPFRVLGCILLVISVGIDIMFIVLWPYNEDFEMFHDGSTIEQRKLSIVGPNTMALMAQNRPRGSISRDMLEKIRAGRSKSVGHIPKPPVNASPLASNQEEPKKEYSNFKLQLILMKMIASGHKSFIRYISLFIVFGMVQGAFWAFQMDYVKSRVARDEAEFEVLSVVCMVAQSFCGEILINIVATDLIRIFGANANMSLSLIALGLRCYYYCNILPFLGPYSIILGEALQGPSSGLYWILIVDVGSNYALMVTDYMPEMKRRGLVRDKVHEEELKGCLRATMIGIMSSSMEGLGIALGCLIGGFISDSYGYDALWNLGALITITLGFVNIGWDVLFKLILGGANKPNKGQNEKDMLKIQDRNFLAVPDIIVDEFNAKL